MIRLTRKFFIYSENQNKNLGKKNLSKKNLSFELTPIDATLSLPIDKRIHSRLRVILDNGKEAGLFLERGSLLRDGDLLSGDDNGKNIVVKIIAANETVSTVNCDDALQLAKAAYHLGNRHVPLQIEKKYLRYQHDAVLDEMLKLMGLTVCVEQAPFEPEAGAYQQMGAHSHHSHENTLAEAHSHSQGHIKGKNHEHEH